MEMCFTSLLVLSILVPCSEGTSLFNFPACGDCSSREDVPCRIERIDDRCYHTEFRDKWPGKPTALMSKEVEIENRRRSAIFTWRPPYDASVESLSGFFLTVNILLAHGMGSLGPFCFHANLTGTDWSAIVDPHSVMFHFDCVTTTANKEMHVSLDVSSSPMPNKTPGFVEVRAIIGRYERKELEELKINYTVIGTDVFIVFGPLVKNVDYYDLCLSPCSSDFSQCFAKKNISEFGVREAIFKYVKPDNYTIMIRRNIESKHFVTNCFTVVAPPPKAEDSPLILLIIILGCLLFVVIATTMMFFFLRKYRRFMPGCIEMCKKGSQYEQTLQNIPNNTTDSPDDCSQEVWFLFSTEHKSFVTVAKTLANIVNNWTRSSVDIHATICENDLDIETKAKKFSNQKVVIILSEDTKHQLKNIQNESVVSNEMSSAQERFLHKIFNTLFSKQRPGSCLISICSVTFVSKVFEDLLHTYHLVNTEKGIDNLKIDLKELESFLNTLNPIDEPPKDLTEDSDVRDFLCAVQIYMEERLSPNMSDYGYRSNSCDDPNSQNSMTQPFQQEQNRPVPSLHPKNERAEGTKQWVRSQRSQMTYVPSLPNAPHHDQVRYVSTNYPSKPCQREDLFNINQQSCMFYPPAEYEKSDRVHKLRPQHKQDNHSDFDWEGPDSDDESVTMSTIQQQGVELNKSYMINVKDC